MVAVLAHQSCPVNGEVLAAGFQHYGRIFFAESEGLVASDLGPGQILERWSEFFEPREFTIPFRSLDNTAEIQERIKRSLHRD